MIYWHRDARTLSSALKKFLAYLPPIPGRPRAKKSAELTSLMPLHPNTRDNGKSTEPPRAEYLASHSAVNTQTTLHKTPSHLDHKDAVSTSSALLFILSNPRHASPLLIISFICQEEWMNISNLHCLSIASSNKKKGKERLMLFFSCPIQQRPRLCHAFATAPLQDLTR